MPPIAKKLRIFTRTDQNHPNGWIRIMSTGERYQAHYVVIFEAEILSLAKEYSSMAENLRSLATAEYGCLRISSVSENGKEITLSYWNNLEQIKQWRADREHQLAQRMGRTGLYASYQVSVARIEKQYEFNK